MRAAETVVEVVRSLLQGLERRTRHEAPFRSAAWELGMAAGDGASGDGRGGFYLRTAGGGPVAASRDLAVVVERLMWHLTQDTISGAEAEVTALHSGAVSSPEFGAVLLPAPSGSGKTTLTAALVDAGWAYLSDELAIVDPSGTSVEPFSRPLCMSREAIALFPGLAERLPSECASDRVEKLQVRPIHDLRGTLGSPSPVRVVIFPRYERGAETVLESMGPAETLVQLLPNTFNLAQESQTRLEKLAALCEAAEGYRLVSGNLQAAVAAVCQLAGRSISLGERSASGPASLSRTSVQTGRVGSD